MKLKNKFVLLVVLLLINFAFVNNTQAEDAPVIPESLPEVVMVDPVVVEEVEEPVAVPEPEITPKSTFIVRLNDTVLWQGSASLLPEGVITINDSTAVPHDINARSVLATLKSIDDASDTFSISNLAYYDSFKSFYLKCILPNTGLESCDDWQYAIGDTTPWQSIEQSILSGGETVGIYFSKNHRLSLDTTSVTVGSQVSVTTEKYNYQDNSWSPLNGVSVGVTLPNIEDPWNPIVVSTHKVNEVGKASILLENPNTYKVGIVEDFYFPSYEIAVIAKVESSGGGGGVAIVATPEVKKVEAKKVFDVNKALEFLSNHQDPEGSFEDSSLYTDWVAIAYGASSMSDFSRGKLVSYLKAHNELGSTLTDNERRAMALLALGENPYNFVGMDYIEAILNSFDGKQFGDPNLVNDDIFALILLPKVGYSQEDEIVKKDLGFVLSKQKDNGSWEDSVDLTSATIQALKPHEQDIAVRDTLLSAVNYIQDSQKDDGGWGNAYSTSWAVQAMNLLGLSPLKNEKNGIDYLSNLQTKDGGMLSSSENLSNRIWATSYAIPAVLNKSWSEILKEFPKPIQTTTDLNIEVKQVKKVSKKETKTKTETHPGKVKGIETASVDTQATENVEVEKIEKKESRIISAIKAIVAFFRNL